MANVSKARLVIDQIVSVFPVEPVPPANVLLVDSQSQNPEAIETLQSFSGRRWDRISVDDLRYNYFALSVFSPRAIAYYLPSYLVAQLVDRSSLDVATSRIDYCFSETSAMRSADNVLVRFTYKQLLAIKNYYALRLLDFINVPSLSVEYFSTAPDVDLALVNVLKWIEFHRARGLMASTEDVARGCDADRASESGSADPRD